MNELLRAIPKVTELYDLPEVSDLREPLRFLLRDGVDPYRAGAAALRHPQR